MKATPWFKFFPQDFLVGTDLMTCEEVGVYIRMLCYDWTHDGLPDNQVAVARLVRSTTDAVASVWHKFGICQDGKMRNARLQNVRDEQHKKSRSQAENAVKRWSEAQKQSNGNAMASTSHRNGSCQNDAPQISDIRSNTPIVPKGTKQGGVPTNETALRICRFMGRKETTSWDQKEIRAFKKINFDPEELTLVEEYYLSEKKKPDNICRTTVGTLLNNWAGEVDRATAWKKGELQRLNGKRQQEPELPPVPQRPTL